jgi:hypothetical protein
MVGFGQFPMINFVNAECIHVFLYQSFSIKHILSCFLLHLEYDTSLQDSMWMGKKNFILKICLINENLGVWFFRLVECLFDYVSSRLHFGDLTKYFLSVTILSDQECKLFPLDIPKPLGLFSAISRLFRNSKWSHISCGLPRKPLFVCFVSLSSFSQSMSLQEDVNKTLVSLLPWEWLVGKMGSWWYFCLSFVVLLLELYLFVYTRTKCTMHF